MPDVNWIESIPSDGSVVRARDVRRAWRMVERGLSESLEFPDGQARAGAAIGYVAASSADSYGSGSQATDILKTFFQSDTTRLTAYVNVHDWPGGALTEDANLICIGSSQFVEHATEPGGGFWYQTSGESVVDGTLGTVGAGVTFSFTSDGLDNGTAGNNKTPIEYSVPPKVYVSVETAHYTPMISEVTEGGFTVWFIKNTGNYATSLVTTRWLSSGTLNEVPE